MDIKKALVVDDSKVAHLTLRKLLLERSIEVDWVGSGEDCIKYLDGKKPDIIFMDVMMPGMDGFETSRTITSQHPHDSAPIIMCSANATEEDKRDAQQSGAISFLSKPYTPDQLDSILKSVSEGTAAISIGEQPLAGEPVAPLPQVVEKEPSIAPPLTPIEITPAPAPAMTETPMAPPRVEIEKGAVLSVGDVEQIAERAAWASAEKVARDIIQELVPNLAREAAVQAARGVAEDLGRRAAHAAVRAAQEAAKQVATEIARGTAERTARTAAQESARSVAEQAAREVSEGVSQRNIARGLEMNRDDLLKEIETQVSRQSQEALVMATSAPEFKQQLVQMVRSGIQPVIETIARETSERSVQQAAANLAQGGRPAESRATIALIVGIVAILVSGAAIIGSILKLF
ncbi:MAG: response regulator [Candidatus Competibacteraceae bacterium]|nr:response regulator [Candidatus Competibacteraceae bacterium]MCP5125848.1 response regulator [Gammaproteobacteria bacterium]HRX70508.1 response regulator [Candidatus Competibacteraceae bacterium]